MHKSTIALLPVTLIYLAPAPDGSDANSGISPDQPVATLQHALDLASAGQHGIETQIIVKPVVFPPGNAAIHQFIGAPIRILGKVWPGMEGQKPTFSCATDQSMVLQVGRTDTPALYTGVSLEGATVTDCRNGVEFRGNIGDPKNFIWGNTLNDVDFTNIGGATAGGEGYEAVGIFNAWNTIAYNLTFTNIKNAVNPINMHAFYIGHHARSTWLAHETYNGISGAAISTRNDAENTLAWDQRFGPDVAKPAVIDWYCRSQDEPCPTLDGSTAPECPS